MLPGPGQPQPARLLHTAVLQVDQRGLAAGPRCWTSLPASGRLGTGVTLEDGRIGWAALGCFGLGLAEFNDVRAGGVVTLDADELGTEFLPTVAASDTFRWLEQAATRSAERRANSDCDTELRTPVDPWCRLHRSHSVRSGSTAVSGLEVVAISFRHVQGPLEVEPLPMINTDDGRRKNERPASYRRKI